MSLLKRNQMFPSDPVQLKRRLALHELLSRDAGSVTLDFTSVSEVAHGRDFTGTSFSDRRNVILLEDELKPHSNLIKAGATFIDLGPDLVDFTLPSVDPTVAAGWGTTPTSGQSPAITPPPMIFNRIVAITTVSKQLMRMNPTVGMALIEAQLYSAFAFELERAALRGSGTNEPSGLLRRPFTRTEELPGVANIAAAERRIAEAYCEDINTMGAFVSPQTRERLRTTNGTDQPIWRNNIGQHMSPHLKSDLAIVGSWSQLIIASWGGITVSTNPYKQDIEGFIGVMIEAQVGIAALRTAAFEIIANDENLGMN